MKKTGFITLATDTGKNITANAKKVFWTLGRHAFLLVLATTVVNIALGGAIFYYYVFLVGHDVVQNAPVARFQEAAYESLLQQQQERANAFAQQSEMQYTDPFN